MIIAVSKTVFLTSHIRDQNQAEYRPLSEEHAVAGRGDDADDEDEEEEDGMLELVAGVADVHVLGLLDEREDGAVVVVPIAGAVCPAGLTAGAEDDVGLAKVHHVRRVHKRHFSSSEKPGRDRFPGFTKITLLFREGFSRNFCVARERSLV